MNYSIKPIQFITASAALLTASLGTTTALEPQENAGSQHPQDLAHQIFETMLQIPGNQPGHRTVHAKGLVCAGTFTPLRAAAELSEAASFQRGPVPVTIRLSEGAPDPAIPDNSPDAGPRGMAIRFGVPGGEQFDLVMLSHHGFVVSTGEEFLELQKAVVATDPTKPHPWPVEVFLGAHPRALKFVQENRVIPASFATEAFFSNDAFTFVNHQGTRQVGRYQVLPVAGQHHLTEAEAKAKPANFLIDDLKQRLGGGSVKFQLVVQLPKAGDVTSDPSIVWPEDRTKVVLGTIAIQSIVPDNEAVGKALAFDPTNLTPGIELSDDPLPALRSKVYALGAKYRGAR
jgi:catalase